MHTTTAKAYKSHITKVPVTTHLPVLQPRNTQQVKNIRSKLLGKQRLSHDALYNLHELAADLPDFIHTIRTHPDLICVCSSKQLLEELDRVLLVQSPIPQLLSYDTTFQLGDFYLSTLAFRHTLFKEAPVIPVAFLIHERKLQACHEELFNICCKLVPSLKKNKKPIVTDDEQAYVNTIRMHLPGAPHLRCWNHVLRDAKRWLRSHGAPAADVSVYLTDMRELFHLPEEEEYSQKLDEMAEKWSAPFLDYYKKHVHPDIESIARWAIEPHGVYDPFSGVTNNQAEGLNYVLKQLQDWREAPIDCMVLALNYLQGFYKVEIARGQQGLGNYHLHPNFSTLMVPSPSLLSEGNVYCPEKIVQQIKDALNSSPTTQSVTPNTSISKETQSLTQYERAKRVIDENRISMDPKLHTFTIMGSTCPHVVTLYPKETCSCPSTTQCYHIKAAKMSVGQDSLSGRRQLNLSQLRKNSRNRSEKKSGRKRPRPGDCDVVAAPDAVSNLKQFKCETTKGELKLNLEISRKLKASYTY